MGVGGGGEVAPEEEEEGEAEEGPGAPRERTAQQWI